VFGTICSEKTSVATLRTVLAATPKEDCCWLAAASAGRERERESLPHCGQQGLLLAMAADAALLYSWPHGLFTADGSGEHQNGTTCLLLYGSVCTVATAVLQQLIQLAH